MKERGKVLVRDRKRKTLTLWILFNLPFMCGFGTISFVCDVLLLTEPDCGLVNIADVQSSV